MTDPKSRVQLALELAALAAHDDDANALARAIMVGGGVTSLATALANVLLHLVDERETQLHPIAMAHPGKHRQVIDHPAPTSSPGDDKPDNGCYRHGHINCTECYRSRLIEKLRDDLAEARANLTHEGATAAEWASRHASLAEAAYPVLAWLPRNDPGARMVAERLEGVLAGRESGRARLTSANLFGEDRDLAGLQEASEAQWERDEAEFTRLKEELHQSASEAHRVLCVLAETQTEITRLKEENARLEALGKDLRCKWVTLDEHGLALRENTRLEQTRVNLRRLLDSTRSECCKRDAVVEAARDVANRSSSPDGRVPAYEMRPLVDALSALDRTESEQAATPPESPVPVEVPPPEWGLKLTVACCDCGAGYQNTHRKSCPVGRDPARSVVVRDDDCMGDPEPPAERPLAGEGKL